MDGEFIYDRRIERILADCAKRQEVSHESFSAGWVHVFKKDDKMSRLIGYKWSLNDSAASGIAADKVAAYEVLHAAELPVVKHVLLRTKVDNSLHWPREVPEEFVLKPLTGTSGRGILLCHGKAEAEKHVRTTSIREWALSPYVDISKEVRVVVLDGACLLAYEKTKPRQRDGLKFFNLGEGAWAEDIRLTDVQMDVAQKTMKALGLRLGAVDLVLVGGEWFVLEVNDGFMMEHYLRQSEANFQKTVDLYEKVLIASIS